MNHLCELPPAPGLDLSGALWRCPECDTVFKAHTVWADMYHVYLRCEWKRVNWLYGRFLRLFHKELRDSDR